MILEKSSSIVYELIFCPYHTVFSIRMHQSAELITYIVLCFKIFEDIIFLEFVGHSTNCTFYCRISFGLQHNLFGNRLSHFLDLAPQLFNSLCPCLINILLIVETEILVTRTPIRPIGSSLMHVTYSLEPCAIMLKGGGWVRILLLVLLLHD